MAKETKEFKNIYWVTLNYPTKPKCFIEKAETQEIDEPFRSGKGWAIRMPFTRKALVIGVWKTSYTESEALTYAIRGRVVDNDEIDWNTVRSGINGAKDDTIQKK